METSFRRNPDIVAAAVLLACVCQAEDIRLRAALNLSLDGKAAATPIITFRSANRPT